MLYKTMGHTKCCHNVISDITIILHASNVVKMLCGTWVSSKIQLYGVAKKWSADDKCFRTPFVSPPGLGTDMDLGWLN